MKIIKINSKKYGIKECLVDDADFEWLNQWKWKLLVSYNSMYAVRNVSHYDKVGVKSKCILMHRLILGINDKNLLADHKDHNGLNNQRYNLRICTKAQNNRNVGAHKDSSSKFVGVCWDASRSKWKSMLTFQNKTINIGRFDSEQEAAKAYNKKAVQYFGKFANQNKI